MKIRNSNIAKLNTLRRKEMDLFFYLVRRMDQATGQVEGVYYRHVMEKTGMCKQSFYNALRGLEAKRIIQKGKQSQVDHDILILDNAFPDDAARAKGYVKLNRKAFRSRAFKALKAHEKFLLLDLLKGTQENRGHIRIGIGNFYEKYEELLGVTEAVIRSYLHSMKQFFRIQTRDGKYQISYLPEVFSDAPYKMGQKSEEDWCQEHLVEKECWRNHIAYDGERVHDTAFLAVQYRDFCDGAAEARQLLMRCIRTSIEDMERKERKLQPKYIHRLMRKGLGLPETGPGRTQA